VGDYQVGLIMDEKARWLEFWKLSGEEGERQWAEKLRMDAGGIQCNLQVVPDIAPYQSMVDGSMIMGRAQHKEHLRRNHLVEIGNETKHLKGFGDYTPKGIKQDLIREFNRVLKK